MIDEQLIKVRDDLYKKYKLKYTIVFEEWNCGFGSYLISKKICIPIEEWNNPTEWMIFAFLHEVGHLETNTINMKRYMQEFLATQWAIDEAKQIGFVYPEYYLQIYQNYIWRWRESSIRRGGKNVSPKEAVMLIF